MEQYSPKIYSLIKIKITVADPECARGGGVSHILAEKRGVSFTLFKKMHVNSIFSLITGGVRQVRPMLDPPLNNIVCVYDQHHKLFIYYGDILVRVSINQCI